jgi:predicted dehydrogenase
MQDQMKVGIIGCGAISRAYFGGAQNTNTLRIKSCADIRTEAAQEAADTWGCRAVRVDDLLADDEIELVINLTVPKAHVEVAISVLESGKHVYSEKPFGVSIESGLQLRSKASETKLRVGNAPDTFFGAGIQTSRKVVDEGAIGKPIAGTAFMCGHGPESWHPNPAFYYDIGGGPMLDMGPYYVTALVNILGPVKRVAAMTTKAFEERVATSEAAHGLRIPVKTTTHLTGVLEFVSGAIVTMIMSFDMWRHSLPCIELYGETGSIQVPDPNGFAGPVFLSQNREEWSEVPHAFPANARTIGVIDMVRAIRSGRPHRASDALAYHVLEVMLAFDKSSESRTHVEIQSNVDPPAPLPLGLDEWEVED